MAVKDLFSNRQKYIPRSKMNTDYHRDPVFRKIASDPRMAKIIRHPNEQRNLHRRMIQAARDGKLDTSDMKKISQELAGGKVENISSTRGRAIAREFFPNGSKKYGIEKPQTARGSKNGSVQRSAKDLPDYFRYRTKVLPASPEGEKTENKYTRFYDAMRNVNRNRRP